MWSKWISKGILFLAVSLVLTFMMAVSALAAPVIEKYAVSSTSVQSGETVKLSWKVTGASEVAIYGIEKEVELQAEGSMEVWPLTSTSYVLVAYGTDGVITSKSLSVNVDAKAGVKIDSFTAAPTQVQSGQTVRLTWKVTNGKNTRIIGIDSECRKTSELTNQTSGIVEVWPLTTTTYLLEATGLNGEISSSAITVNVVKTIPTTRPEILSFTVNKTTVRKGELVTLAWRTKNAIICSIETSTGKKLVGSPIIGFLPVTVSTSTTFTLTAYDLKGNTAVSKVSVTVK